MPHDVSSRLVRHSFIRVPNGRLSKRHCRLLQLSGRICQKLQPSEAQICASFAFLVRTILLICNWVMICPHFVPLVYLFFSLLLTTAGYSQLLMNTYTQVVSLHMVPFCLVARVPKGCSPGMSTWALYRDGGNIWGNWPCSRPLPWTTAIQWFRQEFLTLRLKVWLPIIRDTPFGLKKRTSLAEFKIFVGKITQRLQSCVTPSESNWFRKFGAVGVVFKLLFVLLSLYNLLVFSSCGCNLSMI